MTRPALKISENALQMQMGAYLDLCIQTEVLADWFHIPNEGRRSVGEAVRLKRMGLRRGAPDLVLVFVSDPTRPLVAMPEVKTLTGRVDSNQYQFHLRLERNGVPSGVVRSLDELNEFMRTCLVYWDLREKISRLPRVF